MSGISILVGIILLKYKEEIMSEEEKREISLLIFDILRDVENALSTVLDDLQLED